MRRGLNRRGTTPLLGMGTCRWCKDDHHEKCPKRAWDELLDQGCPCWCAEIGHRPRRRAA